KDLFMRAGRLGEWQFLAHDGAQRAIFEPRNESGVDVRLFGGCNVPKRERANRGAAHHKFTRIGGDLPPIANNDHAPIFGQKFCVVGEIHVGEHFENDVHSAVACRFQNFFLISGFMVIENLVRSLSLCYFQTRRRSSGAENHETHTARDLYRCDTHAAGTRTVSEACPGVSGGKESQGWRDSSHTAMVGAGKFGSAKLPMATATYPGKPSPSQ